jgi:hypothetical protein
MIFFNQQNSFSENTIMSKQFETIVLAICYEKYHLCFKLIDSILYKFSV